MGGLQRNLLRVSTDREDLYFKMVEKVSKFNEHTYKTLKKRKPRKSGGGRDLGLRDNPMSPHNMPSHGSTREEVKSDDPEMKREDSLQPDSPLSRESKRSFNKSEPPRASAKRAQQVETQRNR